MKRLEGGYCPLCGSMGLALKMRGKEEWAYCDQGGATLDAAHTAFIVRRTETEASTAPVKPERTSDVTSIQEADE